MRHESTTATQSLVLLNSEFSLQCAQWLAGELVQATPDDVEQQITGAYLRILNRAATTAEVQQAEQFLAQQAEQLRSEGRPAEELALPAKLDASQCENPYAAAALVDFALALFNANEFVYLD